VRDCASNSSRGSGRLYFTDWWDAAATYILLSHDDAALLGPLKTQSSPDLARVS